MNLLKRIMKQNDRLLDDSIAVIDVETTGLSPWRNDRIVEVAVVTIAPDGQIQSEYETLVNPRRDMGPTRIHGISAGEVLKAPTFADIAGDLLAILSSASVIAGHNINFDRNFLVKEYERLGITFPDSPMLCTCQLFGRNSLQACCVELGIEFEGTPHRALVDARATAILVARLVAEDGSILAKHRITNASWPEIEAIRTACFTRDHAQVASSAPPGFLQRIASKMHHDTDVSNADMLAYQTLIDRVLEDRTIDENEEDALVQAAHEWSLSVDKVDDVHNAYLRNLAVLALTDGIVSDSERSDLHLVSKLLGQDPSQIDIELASAAAQLDAAQTSEKQTIAVCELAGQRVCFTGELQSTIAGQPIRRDVAESLAEKAGLMVVNVVSKKLDILVVADPNTQSGKARKAREYSTRILSDAVFWRMIGVSVD